MDNNIRRKSQNLSELCDSPNKFANKFSVSEVDDKLVFQGYQEYELFSDKIIYSDSNQYLFKKFETIKPYLTPYYVKNRTVLDLGANSGAYTFFALQNGAEYAIAIDMDQEYIDGMELAKEKFNYDNLTIKNQKFQDVDDNGDIVIALAIVHWLYSCTEKFGSIDKVIERIAKMTNYMLIIEWVAPEDPAIEFFHHIDWNNDIIEEAYTFQNFTKSLAKHFKKVIPLTELSPTRKVFLAYKQKGEISFNTPFPIIDEKSLIQSRLLTTYNNKEYWSCIYDKGDFIIKQATKEIAEREAYFLNLFDYEYFPKIINLEIEADYSLLTLEKIVGKDFNDFIENLDTKSTSTQTFIQHCLNILEILQKHGIEHRDIRPDNLIIRDNKPVLIDFGWAIQKGEAFITPTVLNSENKPPDGKHCDVYSMGTIIDQVVHNQGLKIQTAIGMLTEPISSLRITDISFLRQIFNFVFLDEISEIADKNFDDQLIMSSFLNYVHLQKIAFNSQLEECNQTFAAKIEEQDQSIRQLTTDLAEREQEVLFYALSKSWRITRPLRKLMKKIKGDKYV